jgi:hypothetical protein
MGDHLIDPIEQLRGLRAGLTNSIASLDLLVGERVKKDEDYARGWAARASGGAASHSPRRPGARLRPPQRSWGEVVAAWTTGGAAALEAGGPRLWRAAALSLCAAPARPWPDAVARDRAFAEALLRLLPASLRRRALLGLVLGVWPPETHHWQALQSEPWPRPPEWWVRAEARAPLLRPMALVQRMVALLDRGALRDPRSSGLPRSLWASGWAEQVVKQAAVPGIDAGTGLLTFADEGLGDAGPDAEVTLAVAAALRRVVGAVPGSIPRVDALALLRRRLGSPFGADAPVRWGHAADLLPHVRTWMVGEVLDLVFSALVPGSAGLSHQTEPRREFWARYSGRVESLWIFARSSLQHRFHTPQMRRVVDALGVDLRRTQLQGGVEQALVWMVLVGRDGPVTVIEGNANTTCRCWVGRHAPPVRGSGLVYGTDVVCGAAMGWRNPDGSIPHHGGWKGTVERWLSVRGVFAG